jgi:transcriptional regulator GlxA family with amidase domain
MVYVVMFTFANMYLTFRVLETMAVNLPKPVIEAVESEPSEEEIKKAEREDFNEANIQRFHRIQYWMQTHKEEWTDNTFGRDRLCEAVGFNRHLVLQSVRSQGFNNVHDYINSYRIAELKHLVQTGKATTVNECLAAGFGTSKTVRSCFQKIEDMSLDDFLDNQKTQRQ